MFLLNWFGNEPGLCKLLTKFLFAGVKKYRCQSAVNECREYFLAWELREISYLQMAMYCSVYYYINTNEIPNHFT